MFNVYNRYTDTAGNLHFTDCYEKCGREHIVRVDGGAGMSELKTCPCKDCPIRKSYAMRFDMHVWGEDCPRKCKEFEEWRAET